MAGWPISMQNIATCQTWHQQNNDMKDCDGNFEQMSQTDILCQQTEDSYPWHRFIKDGYDGKLNILYIAEVCDNQCNVLPFQSDITE